MRCPRSFRVRCAPWTSLRFPIGGQVPRTPLMAGTDKSGWSRCWCGSRWPGDGCWREMGIARTGVTTSGEPEDLPSAITLCRFVVWSERRNGYRSCHGRGSLSASPRFSPFAWRRRSPSGSDAMSRDTVSVRARWVNACGNCRGAGLSWCRSHRHRAAAARRTTAASGTGRAHARFRDHGQCGDQPEGADGERFLFVLEPGVGSLDPERRTRRHGWLHPG